MRVTIDINSAMQLNITPFMADIELTETGRNEFNIRLQKLGYEHKLLENKMTGTLFTDNSDIVAPFEITSLEDLGVCFNVRCLASNMPIIQTNQ